jgi:peptidoglycan/xylan/chitin deacetylase (PgdA/CDA1 family)
MEVLVFAHLSRPARAAVVTVTALAAALFLAAPAAAAPEQGSHHPRSPACRNGYVGLTFDDGPSTTAPELLQALQDNHLRATMFNQGNNALAHPELVRAEVRDRMWVGNHTFTHPHLPQLDQATAFQEIASTQWVLGDILHRQPTLFRPPFGETNEQVRADEARIGVLEVLWTVDSRDWAGATPDEIVAAAATLQPGGIILMHDWPPATIQAIPGIAKVLRDRGLCSGRIAYTPEDVVGAGSTFHAIAVRP